MASDYEQRARIDEAAKQGPSYLQKFRLYETCSNFYMIGRDKNRSLWRVLKIDRSEPSELNILEDSTAYSEIECRDLLRRMHEGNKSTGGLKFVTTCYGIVGFIKFLGPYYMLLITKRRKIGTICGHTIYAISKNEMIPVPNSTVLSNMDYSKNENRYKKLLGSVDLTKDFFFSYSYPVMHSLQKNLCDYETRRIHDETMFVWNEYLTRGIHSCIQNTNWTVALVYGFFEQIKLSISEKDFTLTLIARRSRHYAGTRYLKRGVNERGQVANDVETEQIVFDGVPEGCPVKMSSVVQNRGSIPLFWSQETSRLNIRPDIIISKKDDKYQATRLHFENLQERYGNPIIVLNLIKTMEKKPRESVLRSEFANAIALINKDLVEERRLKFLHWDLSKYSKSGEVDVLYLLGRVAAHALDFTGFFFCKTAPTLGNQNFDTPSFSENTMDDCYEQANCVFKKDTEDSRPSIRKTIYNFDAGGDYYIKPQMTQNGVLRTNCIDCLDRTNVAQYAYGLIALGYQLCALGYTDDPSIEWDTPLANNLMRVYETMGDTLALQYGGSAAHNKIFSQKRGQSKAATQSQEFFRTLQRYYSNAYRDAEKQDAINTFLGHIQPHQGKPTLQELNSDQPSNIERRGSNFAAEIARFFKRSLSEGNIQCNSNLSAEATDDGQNEDNNLLFPDKTCGANKVLSESTPDISTCDSKLSSPRYTSSMPCRQLFPDIQIDQCLKVDRTSFDKQRVPFNFSNFLDMDSLSSSGNSCEEDSYERSTLINSPVAGVSSDNALTGASPSKSEASLKDPDVVAVYSERFIDWVAHGEMLHC